jgi:hypothetical protein
MRSLSVSKRSGLAVKTKVRAAGIYPCGCGNHARNLLVLR